MLLDYLINMVILRHWENNRRPKNPDFDNTEILRLAGVEAMASGWA